MRVSVQRRQAGGEWAVAWQQQASPDGKRVLVLSIADSFPGDGARDEAARGRGRAPPPRAASGCAAATGPSGTATTRRASVSVPDPRIESFYWIQMYKLASATRADRPAIDTMGPWYHRTPWPGVWWNLNIQLSYWPVYTANRLALGESLLALVERNQANLRNNVPQPLRADSMAVGRMGGPDAVSPGDVHRAARPRTAPTRCPTWSGSCTTTGCTGATPWTRPLRRRLYPLLRGGVTYMLRRLTPGTDGKLHLPEAVSPEYPKTAPDTNYDLVAAALGAADPAQPSTAAWAPARTRWPRAGATPWPGSRPTRWATAATSSAANQPLRSVRTGTSLI